MEVFGKDSKNSAGLPRLGKAEKRNLKTKLEQETKITIAPCVEERKSFTNGNKNHPRHTYDTARGLFVANRKQPFTLVSAYLDNEIREAEKQYE